MTFALNISRSITGQPWKGRGEGADAREPGYAPDDLVTQLLLARGCPRDALDAHRNPTIRAFMPDPSLFRDMDAAAERLADAVQRMQDYPERVLLPGIAISLTVLSVNYLGDGLRDALDPRIRGR